MRTRVRHGVGMGAIFLCRTAPHIRKKSGRGSWGDALNCVEDTQSGLREKVLDSKRLGEGGHGGGVLGEGVPPEVASQSIYPIAKPMF